MQRLPRGNAASLYQYILAYQSKFLQITVAIENVVCHCVFPPDAQIEPLPANRRSLFGKQARTFLRGIRVSSKADLKARIELYLKEVDEQPAVFKWKYKLETLEAESVAAL